MLDSGQYTMGPRVAEFERKYAEYCGTKYCVACNSGSSANLLMVAAWMLGRGWWKDRGKLEKRYLANERPTVIVPTLGWSTSYAPLHQYGCRLIFVDVSPYTLNYDLERLDGAVAHYKPDAILAINVLGNPNEFDRIKSDPVFGPILLEDNCESMGAEYKGRRTGSFGSMASHSTFFSHHICTMEGGMVTTNSEFYRDAMLAIRSHGWTRHLGPENVFGIKPGKFDFIVPGYNLRPTEMQAAIGLEQLKKLDGFIAMRRENAARFPYQTQQVMSWANSSWFGMTVYNKDREKFKDFETRPVISGNFLKQPVMQFYDHAVYGDAAGADYVQDRCIMVGNSGTELSEWPT